MNVYRIVADVFALIGLFVLMPLYILLPVELSTGCLLPPFVICVAISMLFLREAEKGVIRDERTLRIGSRSYTIAILLTVVYCMLLAILSKYIEIAWLTVPVALISVIIILVATSRVAFEILVRLPEEESKR